MKNYRRREAGFHKQALLITLPVVILSVASLYSLRQDKAAIEQDARDRAQVLAPQLASQWGEIVGKDLKEFLVAWFVDKYAPVAAAWPEGNGIARNETPPPTSSLEQRLRTDLMLDAMPQLRGRLLNGQVQTPVDYPSLPIPPDWTNRITSEQLKTWHAAEQAIFQQRDPRAGRTALAAMRSVRVPEAACASTEFRLMLMEAGRDSAPNRLSA